MRKPGWNNTGVLTAIFLAALSARLLKLILDPMLLRDSALYLTLAERWSETGEYVQTIAKGTIIPPLPLYLNVKLMDCGFSAETAGRSIGLFFGSMIPVLGYIIAYKTFKTLFVSGIAGLLLIFHPVLVSYSIQPLRENSYLFFLGLMIIAGIHGIRHRDAIAWGACGVFLSFASYCRYEALEFLLFVPLILLYLLLRRVIGRKRFIIFLCVFFATNIATFFLMLSITNYDISFIKKTSKYSDRIIRQNNVRDFFQNDPQSNE